MPPKNIHFAWLGDILHKIIKTEGTINVHCNKLSTKNVRSDFVTLSQVYSSF